MADPADDNAALMAELRKRGLTKAAPPPAEGAPNDPLITEMQRRGLPVKPKAAPAPTAPSRTYPERQAVVEKPAPDAGSVHDVLDVLGTSLTSLALNAGNEDMWKRKGAQIGRALTYLSGKGRRQEDAPELADVFNKASQVPEPKDAHFEGPLGEAANMLPRPVRTWLEAEGDAASIGLGLVLTQDERQRANLIMSKVPTAEMRRDQYGTLQFRWNPESPWTYINKPGVTPEDALTTAEVLEKYTPAGRAAAVPETLGGRMLTAAATDAATEYGTERAAEAMGAGPVDPGDVIGAGIAGPVGQAAGDALVAALPVAKQLAGKVARRMGFETKPAAQAEEEALSRGATPTPEAPAAAEPSKVYDTDFAPIPPEKALTVPEETLKARQQTPDEAYDLGDEFGLRYTRGEASGDIRQRQLEDDLYQGTRGEAGQRTMAEFKDDQARRVAEAGNRIAARGRAPQNPSIEEAGNATKAAIVQRFDKLRDLEDRTYKEGFEMLSRLKPVPGDEDVLSGVVNLLEQDGLTGYTWKAAQERGATRTAAEVLNRLQDDIASKGWRMATPDDLAAYMFKEGSLPSPATDPRAYVINGKGELERRMPGVNYEGRAVKWSEIERRRQRLRQIFDNEADDLSKPQIYLMMEGFDEWILKHLGEISDPALRAGVKGPTRAARDAGKVIQDARNIHSEIKRLFRPDGPQDRGGKAVETILDQDRTGTQIINSIIGQGGGPPAQALGAVRRLKMMALDTTPEGRIARPADIIQSGKDKGKVRRPADPTPGKLAFLSDTELPPAEIQAVREGLWHQILSPLEKRQQGGWIPAQSIVTNLDRALSGPGRAITRELFTEKEVQAMYRYLEAVKKYQRPAGANTSGTAAALARNALLTATDGLLKSFGGFTSFALRLPVAAATGEARNLGGKMAAQSATRRPFLNIPTSRSVSGSAYGQVARNANDQRQREPEADEEENMTRAGRAYETNP